MENNIDIEVGKYLYLLSYNPDLGIHAAEDGQIFTNPVEAVLQAQHHMSAETEKGNHCVGQIVRVKVEEIYTFTLT